MCGIFGIFTSQATASSLPQLQTLIEALYNLSESRGKESAGLHVLLSQKSHAWTAKSAQSASRFIRSVSYKKIHTVVSQRVAATPQPLAMLAHSRLVTNGSAAQSRNNQPVRTEDVTVIHNGIIVNVDALWQSHPELTRTAEVDTEVLSALLANALKEGNTPQQATAKLYSQIKGAASIAYVHDRSDFAVLATNTGDLYYAQDAASGLLVFASERYILEQGLGSAKLSMPITWLEPGQMLHVTLSTLTVSHSAIAEANISTKPSYHPFCVHEDYSHESVSNNFIPMTRVANETLLRYNEKNMAALKRCSRCILPSTFPFIRFDAQGVCNYCHGYTPKYSHLNPAQAKADFIARMERYRRAGKEADVIVPFSGGRDSSYGLHLIQKEFGLKPITFTYDWGMVTDLARRNVARMCGDLGIQNILVSADIQKKRANIRKNIAAWLKQPDLGLVPLFMAGDKHFFKITNEIKAQTGIRLDLWCANPLENTDFKSGFCGVSPDFDKQRLDYLSSSRKLQMIRYYATAFLKNPRYINTSLLDTFTAFLAYYMEPRKDFYFLFNYLVWDEKIVNDTLLGSYDWEISPDSPSTWRIGDGTAPFYNYIYMTANGFSEFDTFRSNQIREGMITREEALTNVLEENRPRAASLRWYLETVGLDFNSTIQRINRLDVRGLHSAT